MELKLSKLLKLIEEYPQKTIPSYEYQHIQYEIFQKDINPKEKYSLFKNEYENLFLIPKSDTSGEFSVHNSCRNFNNLHQYLQFNEFHISYQFIKSFITNLSLNNINTKEIKKLCKIFKENINIDIEINKRNNHENDFNWEKINFEEYQDYIPKNIILNLLLSYQNNTTATSNDFIKQIWNKDRHSPLFQLWDEIFNIQENF